MIKTNHRLKSREIIDLSLTKKIRYKKYKLNF